jgi:excisionase family DNA binding protein
MARRPKRRAIRKHKPYTTEKVAAALGVCRATVRNWVTRQGLPAFRERRPWILNGEDIIAFLEAREEPKAKCAFDECYCLKCRTPRAAAFGEAEILITKTGRPNLRALCAVCGALMHKRISPARIGEISAVFKITANEPAGT